MDRGVLYFVAGSKHCVHAIVSIASLRKHYSGPIAICTEADGPGRECAEWIAKDDALNIPGGPVLVIPDKKLAAGSRGKSYFCKTIVPRLSPFEQTLYLDADTLIVGDLNPLWPDPSTGEVVLTQFADWISTGSRMQQRIKPWAELCEDEETGRVIYTPDAQQLRRVQVQLSKSWPAINTGVMAWSKTSEPFCDEWNRVTSMRNVFIVDETACQIIFPEYPHRVMDDRFNASVVFPRTGQQVATRTDIRALHGHGFKFWKRADGWNLYRSSLMEALAQNRANIQSMRVGDKFLTAGYMQNGVGVQVMSDEDRKLLRSYWGERQAA